MNIIRKAYKWCKGIVKRCLGHFGIRHQVGEGLVDKRIYQIISADEQDKAVAYVVKEEALESSAMVKIYDVNEAGVYNVISPELLMYRCQNVEIHIESDWIVAGDKVIYDKYFMPQFEITIPCDYGFLGIEDGNLYLRKDIFEKDTIHVGIGYSLGGVHSTHWGHFSLQYLPKLYEIPRILEILDGQKLTVILPQYKDGQIRRVVYDYLQNYQGVEILEVDRNTTVRCGELFYMDKPSYIMEHARYESRSGWNLSSFSANALKQNLLKNIAQYDEGMAGRKLYLDRPKGMRRRLKNGEDVREFFEREGFEVIEDPGTLSYEEKIKLFRNASYLVGPEGTAFMNVIFCRPRTKVMKFASYVTADCDLLSGYYDKHWGLQTVVVCAFNDDKGEVHGDFEIPLERIKKAFEEFRARE